MTVTNAQIAATLRKAADHIDRYGWRTYSYAAPGESGEMVACCAAGAINFVATGDATRPEGTEDVKVALLEYLGRHVPEDRGDLDDGVAGWNDLKVADAAEVTATMRSVADQLDPPGRAA